MRGAPTTRISRKRVESTREKHEAPPPHHLQRPHRAVAAAVRGDGGVVGAELLGGGFGRTLQWKHPKWSVAHFRLRRTLFRSDARERRVGRVIFFSWRLLVR